jgi:hypothetical protein
VITAIARKAEEVRAIAVSSEAEPSRPGQLTELDEEVLHLLDGDDEGASEESREVQKYGKQFLSPTGEAASMGKHC